MKRITIHDTTLRDGEQAPGNSMTATQKLELALMLENAGVDCIEVGFPASSTTDFEATKLISKKLTTSSFATFCRATVNDIKIAIEAGGVSSKHVIQILATGSDLHLKSKRQITREQGITEIVESVNYAIHCGIQNVTVGIEDASRADESYMKLMVEKSVSAGSNHIIIADTTGFATPISYGNLVKKVRSWVPADVKLSTHCHNDLGLSLANALAGLDAGADEIQVTLGGIGERAGNTALEEIAAILFYKQNEFNLFTNIKVDKLYSIYNILREFINLEEPRNKALFGKYSFSTAAGIHQQGMINDPNTYEYVKPLDFARERSMYISRHSGRCILKHTLSTMGIEVSKEKLEYLYKESIENKSENYCENTENLTKLLKKEFHA